MPHAFFCYFFISDHASSLFLSQSSAPWVCLPLAVLLMLVPFWKLSHDEMEGVALKEQDIGAMLRSPPAATTCQRWEAKTRQTSNDSQLPVTYCTAQSQRVCAKAWVCYCVSVCVTVWLCNRVGKRENRCLKCGLLCTPVCNCASAHMPGELLELLRLFSFSFRDLLETFYQRAPSPFRAFWPEPV